MKAHKAHKPCFKLLCLMALLLSACRAFCDFYQSHTGFHDELEQLGGVEHFNVLESQLIPVYLMMDNNKLFLAAAAEKDASMTMMNRIMNNQWLAHRGQLNKSDTRALRAFLRRNVANFFRGEYTPASTTDEPRFQDIDTSDYTEYSQFKDIDNYRLDVSDDSINLRFYYAFN
ncbi:hypothetical protein TDB9533_04354 [Thalassocella blandensis]|nr:hypothetical protein TDB9533_04354 [Thalassocella blandensis]